MPALDDRSLGWLRYLHRKATTPHEGATWWSARRGLGRPNPGAQQGGFYGGGSIESFKLLADWRAEGSFAGVEFSA